MSLFDSTTNKFAKMFICCVHRSDVYKLLNSHAPHLNMVVSAYSSVIPAYTSTSKNQGMWQVPERRPSSSASFHLAFSIAFDGRVLRIITLKDQWISVNK